MGNDLSASNLRPEVLADLQEETGIRQEDLRTYYREFLELCPKSQMGIDEPTLKRFYSEVFPHGDATSFAGHVFKLLDEDGNGEIDFREFIMAISIVQSNKESKAEWLFSLFDLDGTGYIKRAELIEMIKILRSLCRGQSKGEPTAEEIADHLLAHADNLGDQQLCRERFVQVVNRSQTMQAILDAAHTVTVRPLERKTSYGGKPERSNSAKARTGSLSKPRTTSVTRPVERKSSANWTSSPEPCRKISKEANETKSNESEAAKNQEDTDTSQLVGQTGF